MVKIIDDDESRDSMVVQNSPSLGGTIARVVSVVLGVIVAVLVLRFVLVLFGANAMNGFVSFIYDLSNPLVSPFFGMFNYTPTYEGGRFEIETLVAIVIYAFFSWLIVQLLLIGNNSREQV